MTVVVEATAKFLPSSHAIRPRSSHHMQVMVLVIEMTVKLPLSSRRTPGSSVFRRAPAGFIDEKFGDS